MTLIIPEVLGVHQERFLRKSILRDDGIRWFKCTGSVIQGIRITEQHYVPLFKIIGWNVDNGNNMCHDCNRIRARRRNSVGQAQREKVLAAAGGCQWVENGVRCIMRYPEHLRGNFALDHIDPRLKQKGELLPAWIADHLDEFWSRVVPNLQVLCQHHNGVKCWQQYGVGGELHVEPWLEQHDEEVIVPGINQLSLFDEDLLI